VVRAGAAKSTSDGVRTHASYLRQKYFRWGSNPCLLPAYMFYMYKLRHGLIRWVCLEHMACLIYCQSFEPVQSAN